jgi:hypothetical protein
MSQARRKWGALAAGCLAVLVLARSAGAQDLFPPPPPVLPDPPPPLPPVDPFPPPAAFTPGDEAVAPPEHLVIKNQYFDGSVVGLRSYLETIKTTNPQLYAQLSPDTQRLETRRTTAAALIAGGMGAGVLSVLAGLATRSDCHEPSLGDPNFAAETDAWGACDRGNIQHVAVFAAVGFLAAAAGMIGGLVAMPSHQDLLDVVNKHNRLSPDPLRLQVGYDPTLHTAQAGATITF